MRNRHPDAGDDRPNDREKIDGLNKLIEELRDTTAYQTGTLKRREAQLAGFKVTNASLEEALAWRDSQVHALNKSEDYLKSEIARLERTIASNDEALTWRAGQVEEIEQQLDSRADALIWRAEQLEQLGRDIEDLQRKHDSTQDQLREVSSRLEDICGSTGWKFVLWVRRIRDRVVSTQTRRHRIYERIMSRVGSRLER